MKHQIIADSCADFDEESPDSLAEISRIPFTIRVDNKEMEDKNLDISSLINQMQSSVSRISTACPSPYDFYSALKESTENFIVTISSKLSGSYQSALAAVGMMKEDGQSKTVHVIDSKSASAGQNLVVLKLKGLLEQNLEGEQVIQKINKYITGLKTLFLPESVDNLERNGRISGFEAMVGKALRVVPILGSNGRGEIVLKGRALGRKQAEEKLINMIASSADDIKNTVLAITYVNAREKAERMREAIQERLHFKEVHIFRASGLSTVYADKGGLVIAF